MAMSEAEFVVVNFFDSLEAVQRSPAPTIEFPSSSQRLGDS